MKANWKATASVLASVSLLVACVGSASAAQSKPTFTFQVEDYGGTLPQANGPFQQQIERETGVNFHVNWVLYSNYASQLNAEIAAGNLPDVLAIDMQNGQLFSPEIVQGIQAGAFKNLTPYIDAPNFAKQYPNLARVSKKVMDMINFDGKIYALPAYVEPVAGNGTIIIRQDLWKKAGLPIPTTLNQLATDLITIHKKFGVYGLDTPNGSISSSPNYKSLEVAFTGIQDWGVDSKGNFYYQSFMPQFDQFLLWMRNLYKAGAIDPEFTLGQGGSSFKNGDSAASVKEWWGWEQAPKTKKSPFSPSYLSQNPNARAWGLLPLKGPDGYTVTVEPFQWPIMISSKVPNSEVPTILKFLNFTASAKYYNQTQLGVKGIDYTIIHGKPVVNPTKMHQTADNYYAVMFENFPMSAAYLLNQAVQRGVDAKQIAQMKLESRQATKDMNKMHLSEPTWQVNSPAYDQSWSELTANLDTNEAKVIMNQMTIAQWNQYVQSITTSKSYKTILSQFKSQWLKYYKKH